MDSPFLIVSQLSFVNKQFMDDLEKKEQALNGQSPTVVEIWLRHQKECCSHKQSAPHFMTLANLSKRMLVTALKIALTFKWPCARNTGRSGSGKNKKS